MDRDTAPWIVVTGLDGSGKSTLVRALARERGARPFRLPHHRFVKTYLSDTRDSPDWADVHTDRLVFAADARLTNREIAQWRRERKVLVSQRGWMDNYIFGAAQGVGYEQTDTLLRTAELERPQAIIYMIAEPEAAFERIRWDPDGDKFETLEFMQRQHRETLRFYQSVRDGLPILSPFSGIPDLFVDTTGMRKAEVFHKATQFLDTVIPAVQAS
jgi:thymidylate kinase